MDLGVYIIHVAGLFFPEGFPLTGVTMKPKPQTQHPKP